MGGGTMYVAFDADWITGYKRVFLDLPNVDDFDGLCTVFFGIPILEGQVPHGTKVRTLFMNGSQTIDDYTSVYYKRGYAELFFLYDWIAFEEV